MPVYTFTTDFGLCDHYVASLKGEILKLDSSAVFVDVTHECSIQQWTNAAFVVGNTLPHFPIGTVHLVAVNIFHGNKSELVCFSHYGQWVILPNNGLIGMLLDDETKDVFEIPILNGESFAKDYMKIYARASVALALSKESSLQLVKSTDYKKFTQHLPYATEKQMHGHVVHINHYGNVVTNITKEMFQSVSKNRKFKIFDKSRDNSSEILNAFIHTKESQKIIFFNAHGFMEIAMYNGAANKLFNLKYGDNILIQFQDI